MLHGWIILDKPVGIGSTPCVSAVKRALREAGEAKTKVGHGGTLDPLASGVLPIALGEATKLAGRMLDATKTYEFTIRFGEETDTLDAEGKVVETCDVRPTLAQVESVLASFTGPIEQVPPAYSALKIAGKAAYERARAGETLEMKARHVTVHTLQVLPPSEARGNGHEITLAEGHLHPFPRPRHRPGTWHRRPCGHAEAHARRAVRAGTGDIAGQTGRIR
jgi:tRNA pseudouridine55 synthase